MQIVQCSVVILYKQFRTNVVTLPFSVGSNVVTPTSMGNSVLVQKIFLT
jgi:hypothetical protein